MEKTNNRDFKVLNDREHCLLRPGMYIGTNSLTEREQWVYNKNENKFYYNTVKVVPALLKILNELIDNAIDVAIDTNFKKATKIKITVDTKSFEITDDGIGIPCVPPDGSSSKKPEDTCACLAWTKLKTGTSFDDNRNKIGTNGLGSVACNIFSKKFIGYSDDGKLKQKIECENNMSIIKASKVNESSGKSGVTVYCEPDLERFNLKEIDQAHIDLIYQRLVNLSICYPKIKFSFNGKQININEKKFAQMFSEHAIIESTDNTTVCVFPNEYDEFKFYASVNGVDTTRGGVHVDNITMEIANRVRDKLVKKYKSIRPGDIKNRLGIAIILNGFKNPQFDSQTKESLANSNADILKHLDNKFDFEKFTKQVLKSDAIIEPIIETFRIKEELKAHQKIKGAKKIKVRSDKYMSPIGDQKYLFLCEGQSAQSSLCSCLGRNGYGYYCLKGLPINCLDNSIQKIAANQEFKDITSILNLDITQDEKNKTISFDKIIIAVDADLDGIHLASMLIGWFRKFAPNLFNEGKICKLQTPIVILKDNKENIKKYFFDLESFKKWEKENPNNKFKIFYQKGLGSIERTDMNWIINNSGKIENILYSFYNDDNGFNNIDLWLTGSAEQRKEKLRNYTFDINMI